MKRALLACALILGTLFPASAETLSGRVVRVSDGDTITLQSGSVKERVRLIGIDAPEKAQLPWGPRAKKFAESLALGKAGRVETDVQPRDKYGRLLGYLYVGNTFVNLEMVRNGFAMLYTYPPNVAHTDEFVKAQKEAREKGLNIWNPKDGLSQTPYEFRHKGRKPSEKTGQSGLRAKKTSNVPTTGAIIVNRKSHKFHRADCRFATGIAEENRIGFSSAAEAKAAGYIPCKVCNP